MIYRFDDCVLDTERRELRRGGGIVRPLQPQVFDLLDYLIRNRDRVVSRDDIFAAVWHGRIVSESVLSTRINAVRVAIGDTGSAQRLVRTFRRKGIRFVGTVREEDAASEAQAALIAVRRRLAFAVKNAPAVVVLPFTNIGDDLKAKYFADGLTEEITTALSKLDWVFVISRHSSFASESENGKLRQVGRKLGARYVLQGSVRLADGRARIAVRLVDGVSDHHLWAECYDRNIADALGAQEDITDKLVSIIGDQVYAAEERRAKLKSSESLGAWECVVRALSLMNTRKKRHVLAAHSLLHQAIAIDAKCAPAHSLLSIVTTLGVHLGWHSRKAAKPAAFHTVQKALALDADEPWGHVALGYATLQICNRPEEAIETLQYGLRFDPNLAIAHYFIALASAYAGHCDNAFRHADMAERLAPRDLLARGNAGAHDNVRATTCFVAGRYQDGIKFARKAVVQSPGQIPAYRQLVTNCSLAGDVEQATAALQTIQRSAPDVQRWLIESSTIWRRPDDYKKYAEAFRIAGVKASG